MARMTKAQREFQARQQAAAERAARLAAMSERELVAEIEQCERHIFDWATDAWARRSNDRNRARVYELRGELVRRRELRELEIAA